jgi:hypothetical protein
MTTFILLAALATSPTPDMGTEKAKVAAERRKQLDDIARRINEAHERRKAKRK